ncbi:protein of unknown function [Streptococcus thermophilus]|uniref:hypothetical protein n=1 Tax=Streptococcus thermophilus TaxID=1308 RepID=UPI0015C27413|nr:protein of unknown function [Streptococcus thermophilus]CAD0123988.1 protein of unknown function [Streptococcus thermophilus]CAD0179985.1 protein of unknown function [Streptococcus thermophilus]
MCLLRLILKKSLIFHLQFKKLFFKWYTNNESDRKEAELALLLYVYEIRKD